MLENITNVQKLLKKKLEVIRVVTLSIKLECSLNKISSWNIHPRSISINEVIKL